MSDVVATEAKEGLGYYACTFTAPPVAIYKSWQEFADTCNAAACPNSNFLKGVKWSPDGSCCLTASDDNWLRVFDLPQDALQHQPAADHEDAQQLVATHDAAPTETAAAAAAAEDSHQAAGTAWSSGLQVHAGETVYDYSWFSGMSVTDPVSCCFASTSRGQPMKVWDACNGQLRASYRAYDDADEITAAHSLAFSPDGSQLVGGYNKCMRVFNVARPGRDCRKIATYRKRQEGSISGIISCLCFSPVHNDLMAAGSYSCCLGIFDARTHEQLLLLEGHKGGVTQISFSPDGNFLYSGARQDDQLHCWDIRATGQVLYSMTRDTAITNQRIGFSIESCGRHLATGGCDGCVRVFDLRDGQQVACFRAAADTVNGVDFSPCLSLLATASGHRRYPLLPTEDGEEAAAAADGTNNSSGNRGSKRQRLDSRIEEAAANGSDQQQQQQQQQQPSQSRPGSCSREFDSTAGLAMSSWQPGGMCNSLRLWRCESEWVAAGPVEAATEAVEVAEDGLAAGADDAVDGT